MKSFLMLFVFCSIVNATECSKQAFGVARFFNLFVLKDLALKNTDAQGFVRVGGDAFISHYDIGTYFGEMRKMTSEEMLKYSNPFSGEGLKTNIHSLRKQIPADMELRAALAVGGNAKVVATQVFGAPVMYQGTLQTGTVKVTTQGKENYSEVPTFHAGEKKISGVDFENSNAKLIQLSKKISDLRPDETFRVSRVTPGKKFDLKLVSLKKENEVAVFEVEIGALSKARSIVIEANANPTVIVNVTGVGGGMVDCDYKLVGVSSQKVLFNFYEAKYLRFTKCTPLQGVFLAPHAFMRFSNMRIEGQLIVGTVYGGLDCACSKQEEEWVPEFAVPQGVEVCCDKHGGQLNQTAEEFFTGTIPGVCETSPVQQQQQKPLPTPEVCEPALQKK